MRVQDIMTHNVAVVGPDSMTYEAAKLMKKHNVGCIPVCENDSLVGIVTDRDIVIRTIANGEDPTNIPVKDVMTKGVFSVTPETSIEEATNIMSAHQIRRIPVVQNEKLIGMLSLGDISVNQDYDYEVSKALCDISMPSGPKNMNKR